MIRYRGSADGASYDPFSAGRDKTPATDDDIRPGLDDSVAARTGYRPRPGS